MPQHFFANVVAKGAIIMTFSAAYYIEKLNLQAHSEGGFYASIFAGNERIATKAGERPSYTSIYFYYVQKIFHTCTDYSQMNFGITMLVAH